MQPLTVPHLLIAAGALAGIATFGWFRSGLGDFAFFYLTARTWVESGAYVAGDNLNLPAFTLVVLHFALAPSLAAWTLWQIAQGLSVLWVFWRVRLPEPLLFAALATPAVLVQVTFAEMAGALAVVLLLVYEADRRDDQTRAGLWLGLAVALKLFLLPLVLWWIVRRRARAVLAATGTAVGTTALGWAVFGLDAYRSWYASAGAVDQHVLQINGSLWGTVHRLGLGFETWLPVALALGGLTAFATWRRSDAVAWVLILSACLLLSPLGWAYYHLLFVAPLFAAAKQSRPITFAAFALWIPIAIDIGCLPLFVIWAAALWTSLARGVSEPLPPAGDTVPATSSNSFGSAAAGAPSRTAR